MIENGGGSDLIHFLDVDEKTMECELPSRDTQIRPTQLVVIIH